MFYLPEMIAAGCRTVIGSEQLLGLDAMVAVWFYRYKTSVSYLTVVVKLNVIVFSVINQHC